MSRLTEQFSKPTGLLGRIAGWIMAYRPSNRERNAWAVSLLKLQPTDRVLEVGFGPGFAIQLMSRTVTHGLIWGIDHSVEMLRQASQRNRVAIAEGRVRLTLASVTALPDVDVPFDKILDVNGFQFWPDPERTLVRLRDKLLPAGALMLVHQPRQKNTSESDTHEAGRAFAGQLEVAGFGDIAIETLPIRPVSVVAVLGRKPHPISDRVETPAVSSSHETHPGRR